MGGGFGTLVRDADPTASGPLTRPASWLLAQGDLTVLKVPGQRVRSSELHTHTVGNSTGPLSPL